MPRIVPLQLLRCLKVLLDDNGGILSICEVKRIAGLMTKYSKKLVSKCIYVQILKVTKTELLGEFMAVGGWSLVYNWLNDAIRAMNWPLVQEILELLLLCPVDVDRLKINSAPKLVKGLCKDGGNEGVRILAKRLVEQWLKVVTENTTTAASVSVTQTQGPIMTPQTVPMPAVAPIAQETKSSTTDSQQTTTTKARLNAGMSVDDDSVEEDPLADVNDVPPEPASYTLTPAQKKASQAGLVYKIVYKDGHQVLAKVPKNVEVAAPAAAEEEEEDEEPANNVAGDESESADADEQDDQEGGAAPDEEEVADITVVEEDDTRTSLDKPEKGSESSEEEQPNAADESSKSGSDRKLSIDSKTTEVEKEKAEKKEIKTSKDAKDEKSHDKERKSEKEKDKDKERRSSSSSVHKSSSSSSHKSKSSSSSSSKSKSSSSSSSHRSSSDKHRSDKDKSKSSSSSNKDRSSSSSNKHKSSSSKSSSSSASSSSNSKERHRDKDKEKSSTTLSVKKDKEREKEVQAEKDKDTLSKMIPPSLDKLGKIPKKAKEDSEVATSITIPSKKASMSIEIRRDSEKAKTVKTYKSQFRSHGLTEEAPPPPSRKGLKKPNSSASAPGTVIPMSLPSSIKRASPPPNDSPTQKKPKIIDINNVSGLNEKPGAIKLIAPKKIQTLVETNLFSDALSAATGPKKSAKRKRPALPTPGQAKEGPSPPTSPDAPKVAPLKFYQDTLDESKAEERSDKENDAKENNQAAEDAAADKENSTEDDDDIPLKKVKEDIEQKVLREQKAAACESASIEITSDAEDSPKDETKDDEPQEPKKPGPGCGPNGPPGVLMLHRRKGPKKKLTWRAQEHLEQIRYFELDETERVNVTKTTSFMDMKNMERFSERDAINIARRGLQYEDNMKPQIPWGALLEVDDVPPHPNGGQSRQRKVQTDREMTTLRALYFSHAMIPDSPAEAELEPHFAHDVPVIPLDDITGNPDAVNDFTSMPWPEPKGSPKYGDNNTLVGAGGLSSLTASADMYSSVAATPNANPTNAFSRFMNPFGSVPPNGLTAQVQMTSNGPQAGWHGNLPNGAPPMNPIMGNQFYNGPLPGSPNMDMNGAPPNYMGQYGPNVQFMPGGPPFNPQGYNAPPNYGALLHTGPMMMDNLGPRSNNRNMNNNVGGGGNWRTGPNFSDAKSGGGGGGAGGGGNWRPVSSGPNRLTGGSGGGGGSNMNNGVCKAFMRGHCRMGKSCKFIHPKNKRI